MNGKHRGQCPEGFVRVCTQIKVEINDVFKEYEERTNRKVNKSRIMLKALEEEAEKIKLELKNK